MTSTYLKVAPRDEKVQNSLPPPLPPLFKNVFWTNVQKKFWKSLILPYTAALPGTEDSKMCSKAY